MRNLSTRRQTLNLVLLERWGGVPSPSVPFGSLRRSKSWTRFRSRGLAYRALACGGCLALAGTLVLSMASGLYVAAAYLLLLFPLTGLVVRATHGGGRQRLVDDGVSGCPEYQRMVLCTSSWNGTHWWAFVGPSPIVNSLLNKSLFRTGAAPARAQGLWSILQVLIAGQWAVALLACAQQDWNAIVVSTWLAFYAFASSFLIKPEDCVHDWLRKDCRVKTTSISSELSSRRSLLSTLAYLNPDKRERRTSWINPILAHYDERREWESALLEYIENEPRIQFCILAVPLGPPCDRSILTRRACVVNPCVSLEVPVDQKATNKYCWKFITEGVEVGKSIEKIILERLGRRGIGYLDSTVGSPTIPFTTGVHKC